METTQKDPMAAMTQEQLNAYGELFARAAKMQAVLENIIDTFPEFDSHEVMSGADTIEALGVLWPQIKEAVGQTSKERVEFEVLGDTYECRSFFDADPDCSGVEVYLHGERLGSMLQDLPDNEDEEAVEKFKQDLEDWILENE